MKKTILFNIGIFSFFMLMSACDKQKTENVASTPSEKSTASVFSSPTLTEVEPLVDKKDKTLPKEKKVLISKADIEANKKTGKRIPFQELLKANISFTENKGQLERFENFYYPELGKVKFYSKAFCGAAYYATNGIIFGFQRGAYRDADFNANGTEKEKLTKAERKAVSGFSIEFLGANPNVEMVGIGAQHTKTNYLKGNNPAAFITDISSYERVQYNKLYKGIDLVYYNQSNQLKYDYIVAPKADVNQIKMNYKTVKKLEITEKGELEIGVEWGVLVDKKPYSYQIINGKKKEIKVVYAKRDENTIGFDVIGNYDKTKELVIDPFTIEWSTYIGTATSDDGYIEATCIDNTGRVLGTGWTNNAFPTAASPNGYDKSYNNGTDAYVFRLNATATALDYVSYLGGGGNETGTGILVNSLGEICVSGHTASFGQSSFIENITSSHTVATGVINVTVPAIASYGAGWEIFMVNGLNIMYGTITGFPNGTTLTVNVTSIVGAGTYGAWAMNRVIQNPFPSTVGSIQPTKNGLNAIDDIFYLKLNGAGNNLIYGTHYGGTDTDWGIDLALDNSNNAYIVGRTQSNAAFSTSGVYKTTLSGGYDGYVLKINSNGTLGYCTYVGGTSNDMCKGVAVNAAGQAFVTGMTGSTGQGTGGVFQNALAGIDDAFLLKLTATGTIGFFTYLGGTSQDCGSDIDLIDSNNEAVIVGTTASSNFPLQNAFDATYTNSEAFVTRFTPNGATVRYSSFVGGDGQDNTKGFDYTTIHKNGGIKLSIENQPVMVFGMNSTAASLSSFLVSPVSVTALTQAGVSYTFNGGTYSGGALGDFFITVLDSTAQTGLFGSFIGGTSDDYPTAGINILQSTGCVVFGGGVHSLPFPVTPGVVQTQRVNSTTPDQPAIVKVCLPEILPIQLLNFNVVEQNGDGLLTWQTGSEENNHYFDVLKSTDGINFYTIGRVQGNGTTSSISSYSFVDENLGIGTSYYRLKQVDFDGQYKFTTIKSLTIMAFGELTLLPNPGNGVFKVMSQLTTDVKVEIMVQNMVEQVVYHNSEFAQKGAYEKEISLSNLASGIYLVQVIAGDQTKVLKYIKE